MLFRSIFSLSESPFKFGQIYVGTDDGRVHVTHNSGETWTELTDKFPKRRWIAKIEASRHDAGTVYLAQNGKRDEDFTPYLWRSTNHGESWEDIAGGIPSGPINVVTEDGTRLNSSHVVISYAVFCLKKKNKIFYSKAKGTDPRLD